MGCNIYLDKTHEQANIKSPVSGLKKLRRADSGLHLGNFHFPENNILAKGKNRCNPVQVTVLARKHMINQIIPNNLGPPAPDDIIQKSLPCIAIKKWVSGPNHCWRSQIPGSAAGLHCASPLKIDLIRSLT